PLVGPVTMMQSFSESRKKIHSFIQMRLSSYESDLGLIKEKSKIQAALNSVKVSLHALKRFDYGDGKRVTKFKTSLDRLIAAACKHNVEAPHLKDIQVLTWLYPALVLPLEIREDSSLIHSALANTKEPIAL